MVYSDLISIIIPTFNRAKFIVETLESVYQQSYPYWECIVVDDGSTDSTASIVEEYTHKDERFRFIERSREPKGAPTCRNIGINNASGKYIIFLDSDDLLTQNCLLYRIDYAHNYPDFDCWTFPSIKFSDENNQNLKRFYFSTCEKNLFLAMLIRTQWPITSSFTKTKVLLEKEIFFDESLHRWQDWQFHLDYIINNLRIKRDHTIAYDARLRQHSIDPHRITSKKRITDEDVNALRDLMKYIFKKMNHENELEKRAMVTRWFQTIELIVYLKRGDLVKTILTDIKNSNLTVALTYSILFSLPDILYTHSILSLFFSKFLFKANQYCNSQIIKEIKKNNRC